MIVNEDKAQISGNLTFDEQVQMALDPSAIAMHIRNMIRMYANPRLAALREYTSNAKDAHKAAGYKGPVEVTLPTSLHPFLTIKDYGIGLTREEVKGFGQFGRSTKNQDNDYIGGFGLGSKSGLAVATQFTVIANKGGKKNVVVVGRDEKNNPSLGFMAEQDTTDHDGVTIQIPSEKGHEEWIGIASGNTFLGWEPGSILINGKAPVLSVYNDEQFKALDGGWLTLTERSRGYNYHAPIHALVHGVYYSIPVDKFAHRSHGTILFGSVLEIANGDVDILPSRDDLEWTDRTRKAVNDAAARLTASIVTEYQKQIADVKTFREAKFIAEQMESINLPTQGLTFKGILLDWTRETGKVLTVGTAKSSASSKSGYQTDRTASETRSLGNVHKVHSILVIGCSGESKSGYYRKDNKFVDESVDTTAYVLHEAAASGKMPSEISVYYWNHPDTTTLPGGFVAAMSKQIDVKAFQAAAAEQRKVWASQRAVAKAAGAAPKPVDRQLRTVYAYDNYNSRMSVSEKSEQKIIADGGPVVVIHADDALGGQLLTAHTDGNASQGMKALMQMVVKGRDAGTTFVLLNRNHKVANLAITGYTEFSDWVRAELAKVVTRTPMQVAAEQYQASVSYYGSVAKVADKYIAQIDDKQMRDWMQAYCNPIQDGHAGEVAKAFPKYAIGQPLPATFDPIKRYPQIKMLRVDRGEESKFIEYINLIDQARAAGLL